MEYRILCLLLCALILPQSILHMPIGELFKYTSKSISLPCSNSPKTTLCNQNNSKLLNTLFKTLHNLDRTESLSSLSQNHFSPPTRILFLLFKYIKLFLPWDPILAFLSARDVFSPYLLIVCTMDSFRSLLKPLLP